MGCGMGWDGMGWLVPFGEIKKKANNDDNINHGPNGNFTVG